MFSKEIENPVRPKEHHLNLNLLKACEALNFNEIKRLVSAGANPKFIEQHRFEGKVCSTTPFITLTIAICGRLTEKENLSSYQAMLDYFVDELKIDINQADINGDICAHSLAQSDYSVDILAYLLSKGLDLLRTNNEGEYPINKALSPHHYRTAVNYLTKAMPIIPLEIAKRLIGQNGYTLSQVNQMIANKSGREDLITRLKDEERELLEKNEAYVKECKRNIAEFFQVRSDARNSERELFQKLYSDIPWMRKEELTEWKKKLEITFTTHTQSLDYEQRSNSVNQHNSVVASLKNSDELEDNSYTTAVSCSNENVRTLQQTLTLTRGALSKINARLDSLSLSLDIDSTDSRLAPC